MRMLLIALTLVPNIVLAADFEFKYIKSYPADARPGELYAVNAEMEGKAPLLGSDAGTPSLVAFLREFCQPQLPFHIVTGGSPERFKFTYTVICTKK
jgi:hypothetical protein